MRKQLPNIEQPLNAEERFLYAIAIRLDRVIELLEEITVKPEPIIESEPITDKTEEVVKSVDYSEMTKNEIVKILSSREVEFNKRQTKEELIEIAKATE